MIKKIQYSYDLDSDYIKHIESEEYKTFTGCVIFDPNVVGDWNILYYLDGKLVKNCVSDESFLFYADLLKLRSIKH